MRAVVIVLCVFWANTAFAQERWPQLVGGATEANCQHALGVGQEAFRSSAFTLNEHVPVAPEGAAIALRVGDSGVSYGDEGIAADTQIFAPLPGGENQYGRLHWARMPHNGQRLVVRDYEHSWRGYNYEIYALPEAMTPRAFRPRANEVSGHKLGEASWSAPIIIRDAASGTLAAISVHTGILPDWRVFTQVNGAYAQTCAVRFRPEIDDGVELLPPPVRLFAQHLDATLGDGRDEGTLHPTASIRFQLSQTWANVMQRPWALTRPAYNSRAQVDEHLRRWSRQAPSYRAVYDELTAQYQRAELALRAYYAERFGLTEEQAGEMAAYAMDIALRGAYVLRGGDQADVHNPWPASAPRN